MPFCFLFSPFLIFLLQLLTFYWSCLQPPVQEFPRKLQRKGKFLPRSQGKFSTDFSLLTSSKHFRVYFALKWPNNSDLGIVGKNFSYRMQNISEYKHGSWYKWWEFWSEVLATSFAHALLVSMFSKASVFAVWNNTTGFRFPMSLLWTTWGFWLASVEKFLCFLQLPGRAYVLAGAWRVGLFLLWSFWHHRIQM